MSQRHGRVDVYVENRADEDAVESLNQLPSSVKVQVEALSLPGVQIYGGLTLSNGCTSGFSVKQSNGFEQGITTAGHCPDPVTFSGTNLPLEDKQYRQSVDAQWYTTPGIGDPNQIRISASGTTRDILSRRNHSNMVEGSPVCKYGRVSNWDCGVISNVNYNPSESCVPDSTNNFVRVEPEPGGGNLMSDGDSGGPVIWGNRAFGTMICHWAGPGSIPDLVFMPQNALSAIGVEVDV